MPKMGELRRGEGDWFCSCFSGIVALLVNVNRSQWNEGRLLSAVPSSGVNWIFIGIRILILVAMIATITYSTNVEASLNLTSPLFTTMERDDEVNFNRDIRPILSESCFTCHGPDEESRQADLRLDIADGATRDLGGYRAIVPGDVDASQVWTRIMSTDPDSLMPPAESHLKLTANQKALLRRWIEQGAKYEGHWAFVAPKLPNVPNVDFSNHRKGSFERGENQGWVRTPIDAFVAARMVKEKMEPSKEAAPTTLIRRLSLDLTGLPPTAEEVRQFVSDYSARGEPAYQQTVERLLASPHFGERMAVPWLDQARYADTNGYSIDGGRDMWLWRDWVIQAYNRNMPFDQFLTEQIAGDLMPNATSAQRIASGFNRNHMITHEGGTIPEENLTNYAADRVKTTSEVFLGLTMGCAQCHDHKYDPISQKEYYQFFAYFNELEDRGLDGNSGQNSLPKINASLVLDTGELKQLDSELVEAREALENATVGFEKWLKRERERENRRGAGFGFSEFKLLDSSTPNMSGNYEFKKDGTVVVSRPAGGLSGFSHSLALNRTGKPVTGVRVEFYPKEIQRPKGGAVPNKGGGKQKTVVGTTGERKVLPKKEFALTPFPGGRPKVTTVLLSASVEPADQVEYHSQLEVLHATASSFSAKHVPHSVLDERNVDWWEPKEGNTQQHLTLSFAQPVDPGETPFLSVLVFFGRSQSMPFRWRIRRLLRQGPRQSLVIQGVRNTPQRSSSMECG